MPPQRSVAQLAQGIAQIQYTLEHGNTASALASAAAGDQDLRRAHFSSTSEQVLIRDANGTYLIVGSHVDHTQKWCLRALNAQTGQLAWESQRSFSFPTCPGPQQLGVRDGMLFLFQPRMAYALDAATGRPLWQAQIPGTITTVTTLPNGDELGLYTTGGVAIIRFEDERRSDHVLALDQRTGAVLWHLRDTDPGVQTVPGGTVLLKHSDGVDIVQARSGATIASFRGNFGDAQLVGDVLAIAARDYGDGDKEGVLLCDPRSGEIRHFLEMADAEVGAWDDDAAQMIDGLFIAKSDTSSLYVVNPNTPPPKVGFIEGIIANFFGRETGGYKPTPLPRKDVVTVKMKAAGSALCLELRSDDGDRTNVVVVDPKTMQLRYDGGALPFEESHSYFEVSGSLIAYVSPLDEDRNERNIHVVDADNGSVLWTRDIGHWSSHWFTPEGLLVVYHDADIQVFDPRTGNVVAGYPMPRN